MLFCCDENGLLGGCVAGYGQAVAALGEADARHICAESVVVQYAVAVRERKRVLAAVLLQLVGSGVVPRGRAEAGHDVVSLYVLNNLVVV